MIAVEPLGSVVIPAHDEAAVIGRCLDALFTGFQEGELDVVVVCNGCSDETAALARSSRHPVRVAKLRSASKPAALRWGDAAAREFPRLYLDADVVLPGSAARVVLERLRSGALAARPPIRYEASGASAPVRSYYRARSRVPAVLGSLWGAGVYGLSATGRSRFGPFPDVVADDLWVDRLFDEGEVEIVDSAPVVVSVPRRSRDLLRVLRRTYRGKRETAFAPDLRDERTGDRACPLFETWDALAWPARLRRSTRRRTPPSQQGRGSHWLFLTGAVPACRRAVGAGRQLEGRPDMAAAISQPAAALDLVRSMSSRSRAVLLLQVFALTLFVIPSDTVIPAIGAGGYAAGLIGMFAFAAFLAVSLLGLHNPLARRHPIRAVLCLLWLSVLASYVLMDRNELTVPELASADRLLMQLAVITGVALIAAEFLGSLDDVRRVLRVLCWGGAFCGVVAALQFWISLDLSPYLRELPGFSLNADDVGNRDPRGH